MNFTVNLSLNFTVDLILKIDSNSMWYRLAERESVHTLNMDDDEKTSTEFTSKSNLKSNEMNEAAFQSTKFCGKPNYKSPECAKGEAFNAKSNDIWCVGVCLFMMVIGGNLYSAASKEDKSFVQVMEGKLGQMLSSWKRRHYVDEQLLDLLQRIFRTEDDRISLDQITKHQWLQNGALKQ